MKHAIFGCTLFLTSMYIIFICMTQFETQIKQEELYTTADIAIQNAITYIYNYQEITTREEVVNVMRESISKRMRTDSRIGVEVYALDIENGVISVQFTSTWKQLNKKEKAIRIQRSMMIDQKKGDLP